MELARSAIAKAQNRGSKVMVGMDADPPGEKLAQRLSDGYSGIERALPTSKDWNDQLRHKLEQARRLENRNRSPGLSLVR